MNSGNILVIFLPLTFQIGFDFCRICNVVYGIIGKCNLMNSHNIGSVFTALLLNVALNFNGVGNICNGISSVNSVFLCQYLIVALCYMTSRT